MQLYQIYQDHRAQRIEPFLAFAAQARQYNIALCYLMAQGNNDEHNTIFNTLGELLLSVACPELWQEIPLTLRHHEVQQAAALSHALREDIKRLRYVIYYPIKE